MLKKYSRTTCAAIIALYAFASMALGAIEKVPYAKSDILKVSELQDVKIKGPIGEKMENFFQNRIFSAYAKKEIFGEAESAFTNPQDDITGVVGLWQGEFWGKLAISAARVCRYSQNSELKSFIERSTNRIIKCQDTDGYIGSYKNKKFLKVTDLQAAKAVMKWECNWCWNLWCRKYTLWGLLESYKLGENPEVLNAARRATDQYIDMLESEKIRICDTGTFVGMPSMSILKPMLILYRYTGDKKYLDFSRQIVSSWDRDDNAAPNLIRNAFTGKPVHEWYPVPEKWAKAYEMMSCLEGLCEYYRVAGDERVLEAVKRIHEKIWAHERNPLGSVGYNDMFSNGASYINGITEPCDAIHWMRLNHELFRITADPKYMDIFEETFFNAFLAGVYRDGKWGARGVRSHARPLTANIQAGFVKNHCCVDNMPRGFMDMAQSVAFSSGDKIYITLYAPATVKLGDASIEISDGYLQYGKVDVNVLAKTPKTVMLRIPSWSKTAFVDGKKVNSGWCEIKTLGPRRMEIKFDHSARVVSSNLPPVKIDKKSYEYRRWFSGDKALMEEVSMLEKPAARIMVGPLILAKSKHIGNSESEMFNFETINNKGAKCVLKPAESNSVMCAWEAEISTPEGSFKTKVCDLSSACDEISENDEKLYSIFF